MTDASSAKPKTTPATPTANEEGTAGWRHRNVLDLDDFNVEELELLFHTTDAMKEILSREVKRVPTLRGITVAIVFFEPSTRTKASFELAAKYLGADTVSVDSSKSSIAKGESLIDTVRTLQAMGTNVLVLRHSHSGAPYLVADNTKISVINAGDGWHAHPTQAMLDLYTIMKHFGYLKGLKVSIIGDILHSRVARSNIWGMSKLGCSVTLCGPATLLPYEAELFLKEAGIENASIEYDLESAIGQADVIMPLRLQMERHQSGLIPNVREYARLYQVNESTMRTAKKEAVILHPGPMNLGIEITPEAAYGSQSLIEEQVNNGVAVRMAVLYLTTRSRAKHE